MLTSHADPPHIGGLAPTYPKVVCDGSKGILVLSHFRNHNF